METTLTRIPAHLLQVRSGHDDTATYSFYGRLEVDLRGPAELHAAVADYFWPQVDTVSPASDPIRVELALGTLASDAVAATRHQSVYLYQSPDSFVPDFNEGIRYFPAWGLDRLVANPHTGTYFMVVGRQVCVLNDDVERGVLDTIRVIKQLAATTFEGDGAVTVHASAFEVDGRAVAVMGRKGAGKTTTVLAAVATGSRLIANDRVNAWASGGVTYVQGWSDPIRIIRDVTAGTKEIVSLTRFFGGDRDRVVRDPLPLAAIVLPDVCGSPVAIACHNLDAVTGEALSREHVLPARARWLGLDGEPRPTISVPAAPRHLRLKYAYPAAEAAVEQLREALRVPSPEPDQLDPGEPRIDRP